jgi:hypothetical protein
MSGGRRRGDLTGVVVETLSSATDLSWLRMPGKRVVNSVA